ncbi:ferritin [Carbonactinospora thermoautotrophica]|uniref:Ferritin n=1 Tax=Carbonactinospora thermoautotrophica TaxID=1469144 RepID=A0A132MPF7_9ACTN|nr:DNA starvation/stationary phase protection protein [Carbonactinospora thermoautotrophica]KWW99744.1 Non-specific DNA-binding protein Dps / Iron-binding ferritin-like antioxidant protein / Ferroxidase [Carbonactinospora thermoautotrophica]KWX04498.1 ferritin [Carbonactinospora thermoautotrophica]KWX08365.1 ferritin [Carbonactinospora thermoautotrophica]
MKSPLPEDARKVTGEALQGALVDLIDLALVAKQAHWNLVGPHFRSLHLQLDEVTSAARQYTDLVAERAVAIGVTPDGRASTVAATTGLPQIEAGWVRDSDVVKKFIEIYGAVIDRMRQRIQATAESDLVTQDILIDVTKDLEKQYWMFQAQQ